MIKFGVYFINILLILLLSFSAHSIINLLWQDMKGVGRLHCLHKCNLMPPERFLAVLLSRSILPNSILGAGCVIKRIFVLLLQSLIVLYQSLYTEVRLDGFTLRPQICGLSLIGTMLPNNSMPSRSILWMLNRTAYGAVMP